MSATDQWARTVCLKEKHPCLFTDVLCTVCLPFTYLRENHTAVVVVSRNGDHREAGLQSPSVHDLFDCHA